MICHKSDNNSKELCINAINKNQILIIPTDTVYGFSAIVKEKSDTDLKIRKIKGRAETKPFIQLIPTPESIKKYTNQSIPQKLLDYWPGPLTIIVEDIRLQGKEIHTTAFRCPGDQWLRSILSEISEPVYSTSVNRSGNPVLDTEKEIIEEFNSEVDLIVLDGDKKGAVASTIVSVADGEVKVLREGAVKISN